MQNIPIQAIPNQQFSIVLDQNRWDFTIKSTNGTVSCSLTRNNEVIVTNARVVAGMRIIPARYQEDGNFVLVTQEQAVPDYTQFAVTQVLVYMSAVELAELRIPFPPPITADYFDPLAPLPLRFAPQGYTVAS